MRLALGIGLAPRRVAAAVSDALAVYGAGATAEVLSSNTLNVDYPTGIEADDLLVLHVMHRSALTTPAGWTLHATSTATATASQQISVLTKSAAGTETGSLTINQATGARFMGQITALRGPWNYAYATSGVVNGNPSGPMPTGAVDVNSGLSFAAVSYVITDTGAVTNSVESGWTLDSTETMTNNRLAVAHRDCVGGHEEAAVDFSQSYSTATDYGWTVLVIETGYDPDYALGAYDPALVADFTNEYYRVGGVADDLAAVLTSTRASTAAYRDSSGVWQSAAVDTLRVGHHVWNGSSWVNAGALVEEASTNLVLNSGTLSTQGVTVTAVPHTLHFTGTGTVTLSGTYSGSLVGTGTGESNRVSLTFTPTAGTLTLTVSGTVTNAQLEAQDFQTSYIATAGSQVTRSADVLTIPAANLPYASAMSMHWKGRTSYADNNASIEARFVNWKASATNNIILRLSTSGADVGSVFSIMEYTGTTEQAFYTDAYSPGDVVAMNFATQFTASVVDVAADGVLGSSDVTISGVPALGSTDLLLCDNFNGTIERFVMWGDGVGSSNLQTVTS